MVILYPHFTESSERVFHQADRHLDATASFLNLSVKLLVGACFHREQAALVSVDRMAWSIESRRMIVTKRLLSRLEVVIAKKYPVVEGASEYRLRTVDKAGVVHPEVELSHTLWMLLKQLTITKKRTTARLILPTQSTHEMRRVSSNEDFI